VLVNWWNLWLLRWLSMTLVRWWRWSKHLTSSIGTPLFIRNWAEGSVSFQFSGQLSHETREIFHRFHALVKIFYTHVVCTVYCSTEFATHFTRSCLFASRALIFMVMTFWARHSLSIFLSELKFFRFSTQIFWDSEGQLLNSCAFISWFGPW
jgi:hypothetical protein